MEQSKQNKIDRILALLSGELKPNDINPECVMMIGYGDCNKYLVNGEMVSKEVYDKAVSNIDVVSFNISYGEAKDEQ